MLRNEFRRIIIPLLIWSLGFALVLGGVVLLYPTIMGDAAKDINTLLETMPQDFLSIFNMDIVSIEKGSGWLLTEGYLMLTLIGGMYFAYVGATILLKEEKEKTIFFLATKPISRNKILFSKVIIGILAVLIFNFIICNSIFVALLVNDDLEIKKWLFILIGSTSLHLVCFSVGFCLSTFVRKTGISLGLSIGFIAINYVISIIANISDKVENLKYLSIFHYVDSKFIIKDGYISFFNILLLIAISIICIIISSVRYKKKELF